MVECPACSAPNPPEARFCWKCGAGLGTRVTAEERRTVAALFADLVGSTSLGERLDPEVMRGLVAQFFAIVSHEVTARGGTVERFSGDAVLGIFGLAISHEDDAERAVRAAVAVRDGLSTLRLDARSRHEVELDARFGIETGEVVAMRLAAPRWPLVTRSTWRPASNSPRLLVRSWSGLLPMRQRRAPSISSRSAR
jgi:class 3 adenylate cyclase